MKYSLEQFEDPPQQNETKAKCSLEIRNELKQGISDLCGTRITVFI